MDKIIGTYFLENGEIKLITNFSNIHLNNTILYEVIRVINYVPIFYEYHLKRLKNSDSMLNIEQKTIPSNTKLFIQIEKLISENSIENGNFKIIYNIKNNEIQSTILYFIKSSYPSAIDYKNGVKIISIKAERTNPNIKQQNINLREKTDQLILNSNAFEALLYNSENIVTECSKSNIFFVKQGGIYTAPQNLILKGITWEFVNTICKENNIELIEKHISILELSEFDSAFITGTSPKILRINKIDDITFEESKVIDFISLKYNDAINLYLSKFNLCRT